MQLKIIQVMAQGECSFEQMGISKIILMDRKVDTYQNLLKSALSLFFPEN